MHQCFKVTCNIISPIKRACSKQPTSRKVTFRSVKTSILITIKIQMLKNSLLLYIYYGCCKGIKLKHNQMQTRINGNQISCYLSSFYNIRSSHWRFKKGALAQVFSCELCEIFKNNFFVEHFRATAYEITGHCFRLNSSYSVLQ